MTSHTTGIYQFFKASQTKNCYRVCQGFRLNHVKSNAEMITFESLCTTVEMGNIFRAARTVAKID